MTEADSVLTTSDAEVAYICILEMIFSLTAIDWLELLSGSFAPAIRMLMMLLNVDAGSLAFSNNIMAKFWLSWESESAWQ